MTPQGIADAAAVLGALAGMQMVQAVQGAQALQGVQGIQAIAQQLAQPLALSQFGQLAAAAGWQQTSMGTEGMAQIAQASAAAGGEGQRGRSRSPRRFTE